ncbi:hypothetical protein BU26DRAFT_27475 [Trematosphaeria pertusa]|uniref:Uncharacterized protein n=1 Tax=Trematosphaeria pertusa TaxID=390896 RepID=A0A6A6J291_9PLEO|nr:uncharacterized protein BU26DRAFT_27475 [Trematosphaeria pertusa]KAF2256678.1 hypothetical protein BU26DRAFT_27475 [Trematosphaeria pertusa]
MPAWALIITCSTCVLGPWKPVSDEGSIVLRGDLHTIAIRHTVGVAYGTYTLYADVVPAVTLCPFIFLEYFTPQGSTPSEDLSISVRKGVTAFFLRSSSSKWKKIQSSRTFYGPLKKLNSSPTEKHIAKA